jgi:hypothetical protein
MDSIPVLKNVLFIGEYFSLMTTVSLREELRQPGEENDDDFAVRMAKSVLEEFYGWDVASVSLEIGVTDD